MRLTRLVIFREFIWFMIVISLYKSIYFMSFIWGNYF